MSSIDADIRIRNATAAVADANNRVLALGEPGFASDSNSFRIGDGVTAWTGLPQIGGSTVVDWADITGKPATFAPAAHTQAWSTITSTPTTLAGYGIVDGGGSPAWGAITGTLSAQTDLQSALNAKATTAQGALADTALQPGAIGVSVQAFSAVLNATTASFTTADEAKLDAITGTNTGDQTAIVGITGTKAQFNAAVTDGDIQFVGDAPTAHTHLLAAGATDVTITAANLNALDDGVDTALHFHATDRARANHTGTQAAGTITGLATIATSGSASDLGAGTLPAARFDDTAHGSRAGGALHANAVAAGAAGFMTGADKTKLDGIAAGAQVNVPTDLAYTASTRLLASSTGADVTLPLATLTDAGLAPVRSGNAAQYLDGTGVYSTPAGGVGGTPVAVEDEGVPVTASVTVLNFTGAGVTVTGGATAVVNIPGGGGGIYDPALGWAF